ncbi:MAG: DUF4827 family protein [Bacteroidales bacterium]|nr:DUF4827 family protein [Bacteroidales bacterium]
MKQRFCIFALLALLAGCFLSCNDTKTYAEQLAEEEASIDAFMDLRGYTLTSVVPDEVPWPEGVFYKTESGLYVHVVDTGKCVKTIPRNTPISVRYVEMSMDNDSTYGNMDSPFEPFHINYGKVSSSVSFGNCQAWHEALDYVGDGGYVYIIAPAEIGMSAYTGNSELTARFYELRYDFWE